MLEMVEFVFKGQYIGRNDMWQLMCSLHNTCVYVGKEVTYTGIRVRIDEVNEEIKSSFSICCCAIYFPLFYPSL